MCKFPSKLYGAAFFLLKSSEHLKGEGVVEMAAAFLNKIMKPVMFGDHKWIMLKPREALTGLVSSGRSAVTVIPLAERLMPEVLSHHADTCR